ncbi:MAG: hypothetical protein MJ249_12290 [Kiritimatiellae bacterium]|nr:hypothetical protein [Kiritimatiellia bacterium]
MKTFKVIVYAVAATTLVGVGVLGWFLLPGPATGGGERAVVRELRRVPEFLFDHACTNSHFYIDNVLRQIVELPADRPRRRYVHEFMGNMLSMDLERHCPFDKGTREQRNDSLAVYGFAMKDLEHAACRAYEALAQLKAPKRERWNVYWRYLAKYRDEERRMRRLFPKHGDGSLFAVRPYEERFIRRASNGYFSTDEYELIKTDFESMMGRPLRTLDQILKEWDEWEKKNISESQKANGVK